VNPERKGPPVSVYGIHTVQFCHISSITGLCLSHESEICSTGVLKSLAYDDETSTQGKNVYPGYISKFNPDQVYFGK